MRTRSTRITCESASVSRGDDGSGSSYMVRGYGPGVNSGRVLEELVAGRVVNEIAVASTIQDDARVALERMLAAKPRA